MQVAPSPVLPLLHRWKAPPWRLRRPVNGGEQVPVPALAVLLAVRLRQVGLACYSSVVKSGK